MNPYFRMSYGQGHFGPDDRQRLVERYVGDTSHQSGWHRDAETRGARDPLVSYEHAGLTLHHKCNLNTSIAPIRAEGSPRRNLCDREGSPRAGKESAKIDRSRMDRTMRSAQR